MPQNLPILITLIFANFIKRMTEKNVLIKKIKVLEASAMLNTFVTDVTGVITESMLTVARIITSNKETEILHPNSFSDKFRSILCKSICLNTVAQPRIGPGNQ